MSLSYAQKAQNVKVIKSANENKVDILIDDKPFTNFLYPTDLEKPVLWPVYAANGTVVSRGFPPGPGEATDHPHHIGIWFTYENVNGLDFWNNSVAIPADKKNMYGWIKTDRILETSSGKKGTLSYHANWTNQQNEVLLEETTSFEISGTEHRRIIDRVTILKANTEVLMKDAKDGLLGVRVTHALQMPETKDQKFTDDKGNVTIVKAGSDKIANGNYMTSEGKQGTTPEHPRQMVQIIWQSGNDSVSIAIIDHPANPNYPTFWHSRGYGLFAANPLGENIFTNGKTTKNLTLKKGESVTFRYRIVIDNGNKSISPKLCISCQIILHNKL
jgi:hypothetical protein